MPDNGAHDSSPASNGLGWIVSDVDMGRYAQANGPASSLPITYWCPAWWGISPWASPFWTATVREGPARRS